MEEQVLIHKNPEIHLKFNIQAKRLDNYNNRSGKTYNKDTFAEFISNIPVDSWKEMKVSKKNKQIIDNKVRSSKISKSVSITYKSSDDYESKDKVFEIRHANAYHIEYDSEYIKPIENNFTSFDKNSFINGFGTFKLIKYETGDHFDEFHYDTLSTAINAQMIGTALLFPPVHISPYTGGDLVFKVDEDDQELTYTIHPSKFTEWTLITFGHLLHKCTPVESGTRYVLKADIWSCLSNLEPNPVSITEINQFITTVGETGDEKMQMYDVDAKDKLNRLFTNELKKNITEINSKTFLEEYKNIMNEVKHLQKKHNAIIEAKDNSSTPVAFLDLLNQIEPIKTRNIYVFNDLYEQPYKFTDFSINHLLIIKKILTLEYKFALFNKKFDVYVPYGADNDNDNKCRCCNIFEEISIMDYNGGEFNWNFENDIEIGKLYDKESEYNDESGYNITNRYESTCIMFWKE